MIDTPQNLSSLQKFVDEQIREGLYLEYKRSSTIINNDTRAIAKSISSFANADGGVMVIGVIESEGVPEKIDSGIETTKKKEDWLQQIISSNITPRIDGIKIFPIPLNSTHSCFAIEVPKSFRAPHQSSDGLYYRRTNSLSVAMYDYEIADIRSRKLHANPILNIDSEYNDGWIFLVIANVGTHTATSVSFSNPEILPWYRANIPPLLKNGTQSIPPGKKYRFRLCHSQSIYRPGSEAEKRFDISTTYRHPLVDSFVTDSFHIDLEGLQESLILRSDAQVINATIKGSFKDLITELKRMNESLERISEMSGASGLNLSITTLRNLQHAKREEPFEKIDPKYCSYRVFQELLGIDDDLAYRLQNVFYYNMSPDARQLDGLTETDIERMKIHFSFDEDLIRSHMAKGDADGLPKEEI